MKIALDFDDTYTADPELWDAFIKLAESRGHSVYCVTCRRDTPENREIVQTPCGITVFTSLASKQHVIEKRGMKIDVWIDDDPKSVVYGK